MRKPFILVSLATLALLTWSVADVGRPAPPNDVDEFMRLKLTHSQKVLEGLALEDFAMIAKNAQDISLLSQAASWQVLQTPEYLEHSGEFRRSADALTRAAQEKNLDGAALAYVAMTMKCVSCHKYVRGVRMARLEPLPRRPATSR
jgi:cytochrome c556